MTAILIAIGLFISVVIAIGIRHDRRHRGIGYASGEATSRRTRLDNQTQADKRGDPGF